MWEDCLAALFGDGNQPLAEVLAALMQEAKQEVPNQLLRYAKRSSSYGGFVDLGPVVMVIIGMLHQGVDIITLTC